VRRSVDSCVDASHLNSRKDAYKTNCHCGQSRGNLIVAEWPCTEITTLLLAKTARINTVIARQSRGNLIVTECECVGNYRIDASNRNARKDKENFRIRKLVIALK